LIGISKICLLMKIRYTYLLMAILLFSSACSNFQMQTMGMLKEKTPAYQLRLADKEVIFIPMHHIGKASYYEAVKLAVLTYQQAGYTVFYESISYADEDPDSRDLYDKKYRYLVGRHPGYQKTYSGIFADTTANYQGKSNIIYQPSYLKLGVDFNQAIKADIPKNELIDEYEYRYGQIPLTQCDSLTRLDQLYQCIGGSLKEKNRFDKEFIMELRDQYLATLIDQSEENKILVIFGRAHYKNVVKQLLRYDPNWKAKRID